MKKHEKDLTKFSLSAMANYPPVQHGLPKTSPTHRYGWIGCRHLLLQGGHGWKNRAIRKTNHQLTER